MIQAYIVFNEHGKAVGVFYEQNEAIRFLQLANQRKVDVGSNWWYEETVLANNADRFFEAWYNNR